MVRLNCTYYSLLKLQAKFSKLSSPVKFQRIMQIPRSSPPQSANSTKFAHFTLCFRHLPRQRTLQNSSELRKFRAIRPHSPRITRNSHILLTYSTFYFRHLSRQRTVQNSSELCKFCAICLHSPRSSQNSHYSINLLYIMFQAPFQAENPAEFQRITQIPRSSPTQSANYAKFAPFANTTPYVSDACTVAENSLKFQRIKQNSLNSPNYPANYTNSTHFAVN